MNSLLIRDYSLDGKTLTCHVKITGSIPVSLEGWVV